MITEEYSATIKEDWYSDGLWITIEAKNIEELRLIRKKVMEGLNSIKEVSK